MAGTVGLAAGAVGAMAMRGPAAAAATTAPGTSAPTPSWVNVMDYQATGNGTTDDSAAIQSALDAAASGGVVYFPTGDYLIRTGLTWSNPAYPLTIIGDNMANNTATPAGGSRLLIGAYPMTALTVSAWSVSIRDISILANTTYTPSLTQDGDSWVAPNDMIGADLTAGDVHLERVWTAAGPASGGLRPDCGVKVTATQSYIADCNIKGLTFGLWMYGGSCMNIVGSQLASVSTGAQPTSTGPNLISPVSAGLVMDNGAQTLHVTNCITGGGDTGFWMRQGPKEDEPDFVFIHDLEVNNPGWSGVQLDSGAEFWGNQMWLSATNLLSSERQASGDVTSINHGLITGGGFKGVLAIHNCEIGAWGGHGIWINGGKGYTITASSIGNCAQYTANAYDDIHIEDTGISYLTITDSHFDVDPYNNGSVSAQCAVYLGSGTTDYVISNNLYGAGYDNSSGDPVLGP
jgi:Pectate lyase superfamily protein